MDHTGWRRRLGVNKPVYCSQNKILLNMENGFQEIQLHIIKEKLIFKSFPPLFFTQPTFLEGGCICVQILFWKVKVKKTWRMFVADRTLKKWKWKRPEECLLQIQLWKSESEKDLKKVCCRSNFEKVKVKKTWRMFVADRTGKAATRLHIRPGPSLWKYFQKHIFVNVSYMNIFPCTYFIYLSGPWNIIERVNSPL